jgi:lysylphosphatidylglycerol synthetase-like protein (DUF2156 family)
VADHPVLVAAQRGIAVLTMALIATQFFLAGAGAFGATSFDAHKTVGDVLVLVVLVGLVVAALARRFAVHAAILVALAIVQLVLGVLGSDEPWVGAFHGINALAVMAAGGTLARKAFERPARAAPVAT